jgi:citrate lyase subunit beta/citryl-CoA lyase
MVMVPKPDTEDVVRAVDEVLSGCERKLGVAEGRTKLILLVETALGVINVERTAVASPRVVALSFGAGDYAHSTGGLETAEEWELLYPRNKVLLAARANGKMPIGAVYRDVRDLDGLVRSAQREKVLGFEGKMAIHPSHIAGINSVFTPSKEEIAAARRVVEGFEEAERVGKGAVVVDGKLVEHLHATEARMVLERARQARMV